MQTVSTGPRQDIIDALLERGYEIMEATWVDNPQPLFSTALAGPSGFWAATWRNPASRATGYVTGRFLGEVLRQIAALPDLTKAAAAAD